MPWMTHIAADLLTAGLDVGYVKGWERRGSSAFAPAGVVCHWTAGPRGTTGSPSLGVVTHGHSKLPGPLCNVYLARDGRCVIVAAGRANHAGEGGWKGLVGNSAVYGIEAESGGDGDWTGAQRAVYPRLVAAMLHGLGRGADYAIGHNEWAPARKIDVRDWPMPLMRQQVAAILAGPIAPALPIAAPEDDDMKPWFFRHHGGEITIVGPNGPKALSPGEAETWRNLNQLTYPPGMDAMADGPYQAVWRSLAGGQHDGTNDTRAAVDKTSSKVDALARVLIDGGALRDAAVEANELTRGVLPDGGVIRLRRRQPGEA